MPFGFPSPGYNHAGVTISTGLSDSANLARLDAANVFTKTIQANSTGSNGYLFLGYNAAGSLNIFGVQQKGTGGAGLYLGNGSGTSVFEVNNDASGALGTIGKYAGVNTAGQGVPAIYASGRQVGVDAAAASSIATFTPAADGTFLISGNVLVTTAGAIAATMTCTYTDESNASRTQTMPFINLAGTALTAIAFANGAVPYEGVPIKIRAKAGTAITIQTAGTFTSSVYNCEAHIEQVA